MSVTIIQGDLLKSSVDCILQQCNCLAVRPHGLSQVIAQAFPYANVYKFRKPIGSRNLAQLSDRPVLGTSQIFSGLGPYVACLFAQYEYAVPGKYKLGDPTIEDTFSAREVYFQRALEDFHLKAQEINTSKAKTIKSVGFPYLIGCGLAGGNWDHYSQMIKNFATKYSQYQVFVFQITQDSTETKQPQAMKRKLAPSQSTLDQVLTSGPKKIKSVNKGKIRIGTKIGDNLPEFKDFELIICLTKSTAYGELGPYCLKDEHGYLIENVWQATKVVIHTQKSIQKFPRSDRIIWDWPAEQHVDEKGNLLPAWFKWNKALCKAQEPVRYPLTFNGRHETKGCFSAKHCQAPNLKYLLGIPESRKLIYFPKYLTAAKKHPLYKKLQDKINQGINLLIVDVDGPRQESLSYYKEKYKVSDDWIVSNTILANEANLKIMINDPKHPCGHTYGLAAALLGLEESFLE